MESELSIKTETLGPEATEGIIGGVWPIIVINPFTEFLNCFWAGFIHEIKDVH